MPILEFMGPKADYDVIIELIREIKVWVASVKSLGVGIEHVTPIFVPSIQEHPGECVVFYVQELFTVSFAGVHRTTSSRKELAKAIEEGFNVFVATDKLSVKPKKVVVVTRMVDREEWEYHGWKIC